jgi:hypothetical protein
VYITSDSLPAWSGWMTKLDVVLLWRIGNWFNDFVSPIGRDPASVAANPLNRRADPDAAADKGRSNLTFLRRAFGSQIDFTGKSSAGRSPGASNYGATPTCCHPPAEYWITAPFIRIRRSLLSFLSANFFLFPLIHFNLILFLERFTWRQILFHFTESGVDQPLMEASSAGTVDNHSVGCQTEDFLLHLSISPANQS